MADARSCRRFIVSITVTMACICAILFSFSKDFGVHIAALLVGGTAVSYQLSISMYSSLLPCLFTREQAFRVSPIGTAFSQAGGGSITTKSV